MNEPSTSPGGARGHRPTRALFSLTILALAACGGSSSSGGNQGDALGQAGATGTGGTPGVGPGSGSAATDASVPSGGGGVSGGYGGSGGATGGTPSPCPDPKFPDACPARNDVPAICWTSGTICSTIARCGDQFFSCTSANAHYDCKEMRCMYDSSSGDGGVECGDPNFPVSCPAIGDVPKLCWSSGTVCSSLVRCGNEFKSCLASGYRYDCATFKCVPAGGGPPVDAGGSAPDASASVDAAAGDAGLTDALTADSGG